MQNKQLRTRIESIWGSLKGLKAADIESQIEMRKEIVQTIIGTCEIQKIRNSSLLKLLVYEIIIFADQSNYRERPSIQKRHHETPRFSEKAIEATVHVKELKELLGNVGNKNKNGSSEVKLDVYQYKGIIRRLNSLEEELLREQNNKKIYQVLRSEDPQGTEVMIEQLQFLLKKKEGRIKELNNQLQQNFNDKEELQLEIEALQQRNTELEQSLRMLQEQCQRMKQECESYKVQQKQQLLFGAFQIIKNGSPHKQVEVLQPLESTVLQEQKDKLSCDLMSSLTIGLSKYCNRTQEKQIQCVTPNRQRQDELKTIRKVASRTIEEQDYTQQNLLQSMRVYRPQPEQIFFQNSDHILERMVLMQAAFIERAMDSIMS